VHADALAVLRGESRQREVVEVDEAVEEMPGRVDLDRQTPFREVDLNLVRALLQAVRTSVSCSCNRSRMNCSRG
jgi:hypothetical protein